MSAGRPKEVERKYIHTSLSQPVYDRMEHYLKGNRDRIPSGAMRDFIEACVEDYFDALDREFKVEHTLAK